MAANYILPFAYDSTNILDQAAYEASTERQNGHAVGRTSSALLNKVQKQTSLMASGLAQYIAAGGANDITDALSPEQVADYLEAVIALQIAATGLGDVSTPPQFDNDNSIATTAFVKRKGVEFADRVALTSNTTLNASYAGKTIVLANTGIGAHNVTLPLAGSVSTGTVMHFIASRDAQDILRQGSDVIHMAADNTAADALTSVRLDTGDTLTLVGGGGASAAWYAIGGTAQMKYATTFKAVLATNGYQVLPSGLLMQWGSVASPELSAPGQSASVAITFPRAFAATPYVAKMTLVNNAPTAVTGVVVSAATITATGATAIITEYANGGNAGQLHWFAIGQS